MTKHVCVPAVLALALSSSALGQGFRFGVKGGVPSTTYFESGKVAVPGGVLEHSAATRRYTVGPSAEWRMNPRFGVEVDALYKRIGYVQIENTSVSGVTVDSAFEVNGHSLDFPVLAKYRWEGNVTPFIAGGFALRHMRFGRASGSRTVQTAMSSTTTPIDTEESAPFFVPGATGAVGLEFGAGRLRFLPEFRFTRWRTTIISGQLHVRPNQVEFLMGLLF